MSSLVTFGETMLRLSPPRGERLSRVDSLDVHVGGAESNVAVAASALGLDATHLTALPDSDLGDRILHALRGEGVETRVALTDDGRVGTYYFERGATPRDPVVVYDRGNTPIRDLTPAGLPLSVVREADLFFTSGITPALSDQAAATTAELLETARDADVPTAFDVNYRAKLWSPTEARETLTDLLPLVDRLFVAERDARQVFGHGDAPETVARSMADRHDLEAVVITRGENGALALHDGEVHERTAFETDTVDPVGSGDAFVGGYLARRLHGGTVRDALDHGTAAAALKRTVEGDMAVLDQEEVAALLESSDDGEIGR